MISLNSPYYVDGTGCAADPIYRAWMHFDAMVWGRVLGPYQNGACAPLDEAKIRAVADQYSAARKATADVLVMLNSGMFCSSESKTVSTEETHKTPCGHHSCPEG
jgi:hypothetical protein